MSGFQLITEHATLVTVGDDAWVNVAIYDQQFEDPENYGIFSFTPKEARSLADAILTASQRVEDRLPHGNC